MLFTSLEFLFLFLPAVLSVYYLLPFRWNLKNCWLLLASLVFYAWGEPRFVFAMLASIAFSYVAAIAIDRVRSHSVLAKTALAVAVAGHLSLIGVWKYANFVTEMLRSWFPCWQGVVPQTSFLLPIGISFFTFQALSYIVDVYRGERPQRNPLLLALYIALFPQLVAGPIVRYLDVRDQIVRRRSDWNMFTAGVMRFIIGFNKKMLIANVVAVAADRAFAASELSICFAWLGAVCYTLQIYYDFSGYSDMAIGLGKMFGFSFPENFDYPYISRSITEFWRRWHMSLGSWFRDYVYFPLGGSRVGNRLRLVLNLSVVWILTGVWHGANWTFVLWGALYGVLIVIEKTLGLPKRRSYWPVTMLMVVLGWVLFRSPSVSVAGMYLGAMFGISSRCFCDGNAVFWSREVLVPVVCALIGAAPVFSRITNPRIRAFGGLCQLPLFVIGVSCLVMRSHNPFIYFNF